jgi:hypothetical protein
LYFSTGKATDIVTPLVVRFVVGSELAELVRVEVRVRLFSKEE